jgi:hypothetical protein
MGAQGSTTINFGTGPEYDATVVITGQGAILSNSLCEAWIDPTQPDTASHTADEHLVEPLRVVCMNIVAGVGFTIRVICDGDGGTYGVWNVSWVWN